MGWWGFAKREQFSVENAQTAKACKAPVAGGGAGGGEGAGGGAGEVKQEKGEAMSPCNSVSAELHMRIAWDSDALGQIQITDDGANIFCADDR